MADEERPMNVAGRKLMIAIPAYDGKLNIKSAFALAELVPQAAKYGVEIQLSQVSGCSIITKARNALVGEFMRSNCTDLLFVDADVIVNADAILRLLALSTNKDVTAGIYPRRASDRRFFLDFYVDENNELVIDENGMVQVIHIGTGFMMIRRHVLEQMIAAHPEWKYTGNDGVSKDSAVFEFAVIDGEYIGEDYLFCRRAIEHGFSIYLDPSISLPHIGTEAFSRNFMEDVMIPLRQPKLKVSNG
jgi:hypothetical protein